MASILGCNSNPNLVFTCRNIETISIVSLKHGALMVDDRTSVTLQGLVSIDSVVSFSELMMSELNNSRSAKVVFDLSKLELEGSAVIALLVGVMREARRLGIEIEYKSCSTSLIEIAEVSGVDQILPLSK
ncbi:MAG TPA: hypothetical protein DCM54_07820 [Gammaproteobacteria bacterium]|nr:hypothetical protein [Gammaproteobacteria bacterium]